MTQLDPIEIAHRADALFSLPDIVIRINELIDSESAGASDIGEVIALDPALSGQILKLVNSSFYSLPSKIDSISRAISLIGTRELHQLVLSASAASAFGNIDSEQLDMNQFWNRSVYVALVAKKLAERTGKSKKETMFLIGLLHGVGQLVLMDQFSEQMQSVVEQIHSSESNWQNAESGVFGFTSNIVGGELLKGWQIGESVYTPLLQLYSPESDEPLESPLLRLSVAVADCIEPMLKDMPISGLDSIVLEPYRKQLPEVSIEMLDEIVMESNLECFDLLQIINPSACLTY